MNKRPIVIAAIAVAAVLLVVGFATGGFGLFGGNSKGKLTLYGNVDIREVDLGFRVGGRIAAIGVEEGDKVKPGQQLAALDQAPIDARVAEADATVATARAKLDLLRNGSRAQDIAQARAGVAAAEAVYRKAQEDADRREGLVEPGAISRGAWQATQAQLDTSKAQLDQAQQTYSKLKQGPRPEEIAAAKAQLQSAEAARQAIKVDRSDTVLTAPSAGTIVTRAEEPGAIVAPGATVLTLSIDRPLRVRAYVAETDLSRIAPGMKVTVTADGNPKTYHGTIGFISPQAEFTPKTVQTEDLRTDLVYRLRVIVSDPDDALRQGQPVTVIVPARSK
jgi:HlyD family secretion protein